MSTNKTKTKLLILTGSAIAAAMILSVLYDLTYNSGRLVYPMDFSTYIFQFSDLPMLLSGLALFIYIILLVVYIFKTIFKNKKAMSTSTKTRKINPKLGYLGFLGFLGFSGFWTYQIDATIYPFCFFSFFGFFSFFLEGKMSNLLIDERFRQNAQTAQLKALKIGFSIMFIAVLIVGQGRFLKSLDTIAILLMITLSLDLALTLFLSEYFLYRLDQDENFEE